MELKGVERPETSLNKSLTVKTRAPIYDTEKIIYWVCGVKLTISDLNEAKFWPVYGGRNWGWKESLRVPTSPRKSRLYTALPFAQPDFPWSF